MIVMDVKYLHGNLWGWVTPFSFSTVHHMNKTLTSSVSSSPYTQNICKLNGETS